MKKPFVIGAAMALLMIWMLHDRLMSGQAIFASAALAFLAAHLAVLLPVVGLAALVPNVRRAVANHRPSLSHVGAMMGGMLIAAVAAHFAIHGLA